VLTSAAPFEADLRLPKPDAGAPGQHPERVTVRPALDHRQAKRVRIETLRAFEVGYLEDELRNAGDPWARLLHRKESKSADRRNLLRSGCSFGLVTSRVRRVQ
jgi:hypothetical protein